MKIKYLNKQGFLPVLYVTQLLSRVWICAIFDIQSHQMKKLFASLLSLLVLAACSDDKRNPGLFTPDMLVKQLFSINNTKDTAFVTKHGSIVRLPAGSFADKNVTVEIREAFTPAEMLAAGLVTESNGRPLRSGGMIYINTLANGKTAELLKPIKVSVPNLYYDSSMRVYKGVETDSAGINWIDPVPTDSTPQSARWERGKMLFRSKCISCHSIFWDLTGPALKSVTNRIPNRKKIYAWIRNPYVFVENDRYFNNLKKQYGSIMTAFPALTDVDIDMMLDYINNESKRPGADAEEIRYREDSVARAVTVAVDTANNVTDYADIASEPCPDDTIYIPVPKQSQSYFEKTQDTDTVNVAAPVPDTNSLRYLDDPRDRTGGLADPNPTDGMYDFEIDELGWYNIDVEMQDYAGTTVVKVGAQLKGQSGIPLHLYLFCPDKQILSVGNDEQGDKIFFNKIDGGVPLFLNDRAVLFAFGSNGDKMYYGISEFIIKKEQIIPVSIKETTDEDIRKAILSKQMNGIDLGIEKKEKRIIKNPCGTATSGVADSASSK